MININEVNKVFDEYVESFDMSNEKINLKYHHTYRVCEQSLAICKSINLNEEDTHLAYLIALLHDIGRFEQIKRYGTFNDSKSIDHGDFGCKLLFEEGLIRKFIKDSKYDDIIEFAIRFHNKYEVPRYSSNYMLQSSIIRDADKIDIIHNVVNIGLIGVNSNDSQISALAKNDFEHFKCISHKNKKTKNDSVLVMLSFPFDLNFDYSFKYFKDNHFIDKFYEKINKDIFKPYVKTINKFIEGKCENAKCKICTKRSRERKI